jgi:serine/threonine protein kinase
LNDGDSKSDIWSLAVACYILFTGKFPFEGEGNVLRENILGNINIHDLLQENFQK